MKGDNVMPFKVVRNDITKMKVDAIVNPTNRYLKGNDSIDAIVHKAGGEPLEAECQALNGCEVGEAKITNAYNLPCKFIIHTVGPVWTDGKHQEREKLFECYKNSVVLAKKRNISSIAFPLISSGNFAFPKDIALDVACEALNRLSNDNMMIYLVIYDTQALEVGKNFLDIEYLIPSDVQIDSTCLKPEDFEIEEKEYREELSECKSKIEELYNQIYSATMRLFMLNQIYRDLDSGIDSSQFIDIMCDVERCCQESFHQKVQDLKNRVSEIESINTIHSLIATNRTEHSFSELLFSYIKERNLENTYVYKKANISRQAFSLIFADFKGDYHPSKEVAISFALALELTLEETQCLLSTAGYVLSNSLKEDLIIKECIVKKIYDIAKVNCILVELCGHGLEKKRKRKKKK